MKKLSRFTAMLTAIIMLLGAVSAMAAPGDGIIYRQGDSDFSVSYIAYYEGVLYMSDYGENIYTWTRESGEVTAHPIPGEFSQADDENSTSFRRLIGGDDGLYMLYSVNSNDQDNGDDSFKNMLLYKITVDGGELVFETEPAELSWDDLVEEYDDGYTYAKDIQQAYVSGGKLIGQSYDDAGNSVVVVIDIEDDDVELIQVDYMSSMCAYTEGKVLVSLRDWNSDGEPVSIAALDLETEDIDVLGTLSTAGWSYPASMAYDADDNTLYYVLNGELCRLAGMDFSAPEAISAANVESWGDSPAIVTDDNYYICADYQTVIIRNTDPSQRSEQSITVYTNYCDVMDQAYYDFTAANPDVEVVLATSYEDITQAMLNQSSAVDVYTVSVNTQDYSALLKRGYMAELDDSDIITGFVGEVYPELRKVLVGDSGVVAVPVEMWANCMSYNPVAFEKLGLTEADVPTSWPEFLALLQRLPELMGENSAVTVVDPYYTQADLRNTLFQEIVDDYMLYLQQDGVEFAFNTDILRSVLAELEKVDFAALGLPEEYEDYDSYEYNEETILFNTYSSISCEIYNYTQQYSRPMPLAMEQGGRPAVSANLTVAFVNPYSENRELAIEYLEYAIANIEPVYRANMCPGSNEPVENSYYQEALDSYDESIANIEDELAKAEDDETREQWQQQLDEMTKWRDEYEQNYRWSASAESIELYRSYADYLTPTQYIGFDEEASEEFYSLMSQYIDGSIDLDTFLTNIDKKIRMMVLEDM